MSLIVKTPRTPVRPTGRAFTLVELLTVMAIISVLLAVTVPALKGITGSGGRKSAVRTLMGALDQARMLAISEGKATYVVFGGMNLVGTNADSLVGRSYSIYQDGPQFTPVQRSAWVLLPVGVAFKVSADYRTLINRDLNKDNPDPEFAVVAPKGPTGSLPISALLPYVKFDPTGAVDSTVANDPELQHFRILIFEGSVSSKGQEIPTRRVSGSGSAGALFDEVRINAATGRAKYTLDPNDNLPANS